MSSDLIFGSNVVLPSFPDLKSNCEEELTLLMKEIDLIFQKRHEEYRKETSRLKSLCQTQKEEIEGIKTLLSTKQAGIETYEGSKNKLTKEVEKLKEEILLLKRENNILQHKSDFSAKCENELEIIKKRLQAEEEENAVLRGRLIKLEEESRVLKNNCQKLANIVASEEAEKIEGNRQEKKMMADSVDNLIDLEIEKYAEEETKMSNELHFRINNIIYELEKKLGET